MNKQTGITKVSVRNPVLSKMRKRYIVKLIIRIIVLILCVVMYIIKPEEFSILDGMNFFKKFSVLHIFWLMWMADMSAQLIPGGNMPLGSQKVFKARYKQISDNINKEALKRYTKKMNLRALGVFAAWAALIAGVGTLYFTGVIDKGILLIITAFFYVADLICVLFWCPFRIMLGNKCCTTCRIFNWDHMMMFSPMMFICSFYSISLAAVALVAFFIWEMTVFLHPERFWESSNSSLKCANCTEKLCSHRCKKRVKPL